MGKQEDFVLRALEERDVRFVRLWFTDVLGSLKSVAIAPAELEGAFTEGIGFDGSSIEGFARVHESDMLAKPDPSTFQILPWRGETPSTARMFCDILMPDGTPSFADPRFVLKRALLKAADAGFTFYTHPEIEFYVFKGKPEAGGRPVPVDDSGYFDHTAQGGGQDFRREVITMLENMGISVEFSHHEAGPGQQEIDLRYADALSTADNIMTFRTVVREVALSQGKWASFMPKAFTEHPGLRHAHAPLAVRGRRERLLRSRCRVPAVADRPGVHRRHPPAHAGDHRGHQPVGQLLQAAGRRGRGPQLRVLGPQQPLGAHPRADVQAAEECLGAHRASRHRRRLQTRTSPSRSCWPPGMKGVEEKYELPPEAEDDVWSLSENERRAMGLAPLPRNLDEAIRMMEDSDLVAETLGEHVFEFFLRNKRAEWQDYRSQVTQFEIDRLMPVL